MNHKSSKLELKVEKILQQNNISFKREVSFNDLNGCNNTPLRFDFVIYKNNKGQSYCEKCYEKLINKGELK